MSKIIWDNPAIILVFHPVPTTTPHHPEKLEKDGYTGPLLFLFERTHNYYGDNQGLVPWRLRRMGRSKVRSAVCVALFY